MKSVVIASKDGCSKCKMLENMVPGAEIYRLDPKDIVAFARLCGVSSIPFVVTTGEPEELAYLLS